MRKSWFGRLKKPLPPRRLLWAAALLNGLIAAVTFHVGVGFYSWDTGEFPGRSWGESLYAVPGAILLYYWFGKWLCRRHDLTRGQIVQRGVGWGALVAFGNVPITMFLFMIRFGWFHDDSIADAAMVIPEFISMTMAAALLFAPLAIFCGLCLGLASSLVVWHGHVAPKQREILRLQGEHPEVPDEALSRAAPPGEPEPTQASLSRSEAPEEAPSRLAAGVDRAAKVEEQEVKEEIR
jgi:hypothetical protein